METDRSTVGGPDRESAPPPPTGGSSDQSTGEHTGHLAEQPSDGASGHARNRAAGSTADGSSGPSESDSAGSAKRGATTARAVLRPVPEGFPTPPPGPGRPTRRPAVQQPGDAVPDPDDPQRKRLIIVSLVVVAVLVLVVAIGGSILAYRALSPRPGPDGEFAIVTLEINNGSPEGVIIEGDENLETAGGTMHEPLADAAAQYSADSDPYGVVPAGTRGTFHLVDDLPADSEPTGVHLDFSDNASGGEGLLPVTG